MTGAVALLVLISMQPMLPTGRPAVVLRTR
jgi:hypothetical protein